MILFQNLGKFFFHEYCILVYLFLFIIVLDFLILATINKETMCDEKKMDATGLINFLYFFEIGRINLKSQIKKFRAIFF